MAGSGNKGDLLGSKLTGNGSPLFEVDIVQPPLVDPVSISECSVEEREREREWLIGISATGIIYTIIHPYGILTMLCCNELLECSVW